MISELKDLNPCELIYKRDRISRKVRSQLMKMRKWIISVLAVLLVIALAGCATKEEKAKPKKAPEPLVINTKAVSYTHLDVYKRQERFWKQHRHLKRTLTLQM